MHKQLTHAQIIRFSDNFFLFFGDFNVTKLRLFTFQFFLTCTDETTNSQLSQLSNNLCFLERQRTFIARIAFSHFM